MHNHPCQLQLTFDNWLAQQRLVGRLRHASSETVYRAMWQALCSWCQAQQPALRLSDLRGRQLQAYLASRHGLLAADGVLTPRYQQRLLSLVQRVQAHQAWQRQQALAGPAQALAMATAPTGRQPDGQPGGPASSPLPAPAHGLPEPPLHLPPAQLQQLQAWLVKPDHGPAGRWQTQRDRCAAALQLGAGLGPGDLRTLRSDDVQRLPGPTGTTGQAGAARWQLQVAANGSAPAHTAPLAGWAAAVLQQWLTIRATQALAGPWLLPATRSGKPWGKVAQYEAARRVLADAGLNPDGGGSFRLRHSFALRQLQQGQDPALVARWLGVADPQVMQRYQQVLAGWPAAPPSAVDGAQPGGWPL